MAAHLAPLRDDRGLAELENGARHLLAHGIVAAVSRRLLVLQEAEEVGQRPVRAGQLLDRARPPPQATANVTAPSADVGAAPAEEVQGEHTLSDGTKGCRHT